MQQASTEAHRQLNLAIERHREIPGSWRAYAREVVRAVVRIVGHDHGPRPQTAFEQIQNIRIERLGPIEQNEIDRLRQVSRQCLQRIALADLDQIDRLREVA